MKDGPDIALLGSLVGDPARANMLTALLAGKALSAGELAREAGVTAPTASAHLLKLQAGGLIGQERQGRHRYYRLAGPHVAEVLEGMMGLAARVGHARARTGPREPALRQARVCYDHLAGDFGVAMLDGLLAADALRRSDGTMAVTAAGERLFSRSGIELAGLQASRRQMCRECLDWSERRAHLAGSLGAALLHQIYTQGWARRDAQSRAVIFTPAGAAAFRRAYRVDAKP